MHSLLTHHLPAIRQVFRKNSVKKAYAFGSVCTDAFGEDSDVDILIDFHHSTEPNQNADLLVMR